MTKQTFKPVSSFYSDKHQSIMRYLSAKDMRWFDQDDEYMDMSWYERKIDMRSKADN